MCLGHLLASPILDNLLMMSLDLRSDPPLHDLYSSKSFRMKGIDLNNVAFCVFKPGKIKSIRHMIVQFNCQLSKLKVDGI